MPDHAHTLIRNRKQALEAAMHRGLLVPLDASLALRAARIGSDLKLPLADSVILATARTYQALIWTQDAHFKGLEGVRYAEKS
jgi:predicted nucleic acid-binding protein